MTLRACHYCHGKGTIELTGVYAETLALLRKQKQPISGAALARLAGTTNEAMCNRLVALEGWCLAFSERYGREKLWRVAK